jgi:hypothetical protein
MGMFGNAHTVDPSQAQQDYARLLGAGEQVQAAYQLVRDVILFTDRRLILVDKQGITGRKVEYLSIPYRSILYFSVTTEGHLMAEARMHIWVDGMKDPIEKEFNNRVDIYQVQGILSAFVVPR